MEPGVELRAAVLMLMTKISDLAKKPQKVITPVIGDLTSLIANATHPYTPCSTLARCSSFTPRSKGVCIPILDFKALSAQSGLFLKITQARIQLKDTAHSQCIHWGKWKSLWKHTIILYLGTVRGWGWPSSCLPWEHLALSSQMSFGPAPRAPVLPSP